MIVVSSSIDKGTAVAYEGCQRWRFLMEGSRGIKYIACAGDGRFYAIGWLGVVHAR
ncbi:hypothetical protein MA16_Dca001197 [Dendrobium catenatum]|uniref:Uncharacterized protein n=1 Tax=Dendrobium catenatum TaxID=906689 RepID=A0A2I0WLQ6_9ASPA|nr:hypothetical protein MA16_Dca001197 [Dendrobium catenatum]